MTSPCLVVPELFCKSLQNPCALFIYLQCLISRFSSAVCFLRCLLSSSPCVFIPSVGLSSFIALSWFPFHSLYDLCYSVFLSAKDCFIGHLPVFESPFGVISLHSLWHRLTVDEDKDGGYVKMCSGAESRDFKCRNDEASHDHEMTIWPSQKILNSNNAKNSDPCCHWLSQNIFESVTMDFFLDISLETISRFLYLISFFRQVIHRF